jgi:hypothetical protein
MVVKKFVIWRVEKGTICLLTVFNYNPGPIFPKYSPLPNTPPTPPGPHHPLKKNKNKLFSNLFFKFFFQIFFSNFLNTFLIKKKNSGAKQHCFMWYHTRFLLDEATRNKPLSGLKYSGTTFPAHHITIFFTTRRIFKCSFTFDYTLGYQFSKLHS